MVGELEGAVPLGFRWRARGKRLNFVRKRDVETLTAIISKENGFRRKLP